MVLKGCHLGFNVIALITPTKLWLIAGKLEPSLKET